MYIYIYTCNTQTSHDMYKNNVWKKSAVRGQESCSSEMKHQTETYQSWHWTFVRFEGREGMWGGGSGWHLYLISSGHLAWALWEGFSPPSLALSLTFPPWNLQSAGVRCPFTNNNLPYISSPYSSEKNGLGAADNNRMWLLTSRALVMCMWQRVVCTHQEAGSIDWQPKVLSYPPQGNLPIKHQHLQRHDVRV